ncbi:uncharacterized protein EV422DRAFT_522623 [Fimicolochytrium jonesii]|uniref:uncharacterized protein n=1 Tax=Fimicolochytrium jonesii TaxID=1396493 RepID=UPI0022FE0045|nr:uncharacterized protein EV422DRAFT_522623 [Fimicolochytrium jonesii]KAI8822899.1 hypothetical protein EV422DRAFT_522623 [Fimicolochytrium jonesii]
MATQWARIYRSPARWSPWEKSVAAAVALYFIWPLLTTRSIANIVDSVESSSRSTLSSLDLETRFDRSIILSEKEQKADEVLARIRSTESLAFQVSGTFPPHLRFPVAKPLMEESELYTLLRQMPKGGILHGHLEAMVDMKWLINTTVEGEHGSTCFVRYEEKTVPTFDQAVARKEKFAFFKFASSSSGLPPDEGWATCKEVRDAFPGGANAYDSHLELQNSVIRDIFKNDDAAWAQFLMSFEMLGSILRYDPMFEAYIGRLIQQFYEDGILYVEIRMFKWETYLANGDTKPFSAVLRSVRRIVAKFKQTHPDFQDLRFVWQEVRSLDNSVIAASIGEAIQYRKSHPDQIVALDLVGHEVTRSLDEVLQTLVQGQRTAKRAGVSLPLVLHAGETQRCGPAPDANLVDALLLGTKRIGHGIALSRHPGLIKRVIDQNIAVEVAPISNQMLGYVKDLREHPVIDLLLSGVQVTLAPDDPMLYGYEGVTPDYYQVYMAFESLDLRSLKQLSLNGITFSGLTRAEQRTAKIVWDRRWKDWVDFVIASGK